MGQMQRNCGGGDEYPANSRLGNSGGGGFMGGNSRGGFGGRGPYNDTGMGNK